MECKGSQIPKGIVEFEGDVEWFHKNVDLLRKRDFVGKFVAIENKEVIASGKDFNLVVNLIENKGKNPACIVIEYVYPEGTIILF